MEGRIRIFYFLGVLFMLLLGFRSCFIDKRGVNIKPTKTKPICKNTSVQSTSL